MISCCRENHEDLDQTSIESEVFDIDLDGGGISDGEYVNEGDDVNERESIDMARTTSASSLPYTVPQEVMPDDVVKSKKCLAFSFKIMELLTSLHGKVCHRNNCTEPLQYKRVLLALVSLFLGRVVVAIWEEDGHPSQHAKMSGLATFYLHLQLHFWETHLPK